MSTINALRETFPENQFVRNHSIITEGGQSVQFMPSKVVIESHVNLNIMARSSGGTDMGNLGAVIPCIQPYSSGAIGGTHSCNYEIKYPS